MTELGDLSQAHRTRRHVWAPSVTITLGGLLALCCPDPAMSAQSKTVTLDYRSTQPAQPVFGVTRLGRPMGTPATASELYGVTSAALVQDKVWVAHAGAIGLLVFDPNSGNLVRKLGQQGAGPGEFSRQPFIIGRMAGSLLVSDGYNGEVRVLDQSGREVSSFRPPWLASVGTLTMVGSFRDGSLLAYEQTTPKARLAQAMEESSRTGRTVYLLDSVSFFLAPRKSLGRRPARGVVLRDTAYKIGTAPMGAALPVRVVGMVRRNGGVSGSSVMGLQAMPVVPDVQLAVGDTTFFHFRGGPQTWELFAYNMRGEPIARVLLPLPRANEAAEPNQDYEVRLGAKRVGFLVDSKSRAWVEQADASPAAALGFSEWWVFNAGGRFEMKVRLPANMRPLSVDGDRVLGLRALPDEFQQLEVYTLGRLTSR